MEGEAKCSCQHCKQNLLFPLDLNNTMGECPHCRRTTLLKNNHVEEVIKTLESRVSLPEPTPVKPDSAQAIRDRAEMIQVIASVMSVIGVLFILLGVFAKLDMEEKSMAACFAIAEWLIAPAFALFLLAQIMHIRANTTPGDK